jgi:hypothetical protein
LILFHVEIIVFPGNHTENFFVFSATGAMALMFTLQHEFELSTLPSIPSNGHVGGHVFKVFINFQHKQIYQLTGTILSL